jgi:hypothetical protein
MAQLQTCQTCKHWSFDERDWQYDGARLGQCKAIRMREEIVDDAYEGKETARWEIDYDEQIKIEGAALTAAKAVAVDGSGYFACIRTTGDFGCVLHSPTLPVELIDQP